jgi:GT2 family glycosyltransferase
MDRAEISIVIPVWNGREFLAACLDAVLAQDGPGYEIVAVDNASRDGSADWIAERYPQVRLIRNHDNVGFAGACNRGIAAAQGHTLVLLNQDTRVHAGWLAALADLLREERVGAAGSKVFYLDGRTLQHAGGWIDWPLALTHHHGYGEADNGQWDVPRQVDYVTGASLAFRREVFEQVGPLDEGFWPGYYEDVDFCCKLREAGYEVWYVPTSVLTHAETTSLTDWRAISCASQRGRLRFLLKHTGAARIVNEWAPAERSYQRQFGEVESLDALRMAYLDAISIAATTLEQGRASLGAIDEVLTTLQQLYLAVPGPLFPPLDEFAFRSSVPLAGPIVAWLRSLAYGVAARWATRYLAQQQERVNRRQAVFDEQYVRSLVTLARQVARTEARLRGSLVRPTASGGIDDGG